MTITKFEDLEIWQISLKITKKIYDITSIGIFAKDFGLKDQIRRAIVSVSSNIVEGFEKNNNNEFKRYLKISKGSAGEVRNQLYVALNIGYITKEKFKEFDDLLKLLAGKIGAFIVYLQKNKKIFNKQTR